MYQKSEMSKVISFRKWQLLFLLVSIILLLYLVTSFLRPSKKDVPSATTHINSHYIEWPELRVADDSEVGFFMITGLFMYFSEYPSPLTANSLSSLEKLYKVGAN